MSIETSLALVRASLATALQKAGRNPSDLTLIAVSKTQPAAAIRAALAAGQIDFGENRVQEAADKWPAVKADHPAARLHLIGPLQTNKARDAVKLFDVIHSLDRPALADRLAVHMRETGRSIPCFVQVNTGREPQKSGADPADVEALVRHARERCGLALAGLMCIPPLDEDPAVHFAFLRELARRNGLHGLSMGMSADAETAIAFGATHVRIGTAIFGARAPHAA
jgi:pyridoxal phosphate enzyme (YggS family)